MDWIVVEGVKPYDGRYELADSAEFSIREWGWIKRFTSYQPWTVENGFANGDAELIAVLAVIALHRAGKFAVADVGDVWERFQAAPFLTSVRFDSDTPAEEEPEAGPVDPPAANLSGNGGSSGPESTSSETSPDHRNGSGTQEPASSVYDPATWAT